MFNLISFEHDCYNGNFEEATRQLGQLVLYLDQNLGDFGPNFTADVSISLSPINQKKQVISRICAAISCLLSNSSYSFSQNGLNHFFSFHRWISALFAASEFVNCDHVLKALNTSKDLFNSSTGEMNLNIKSENFPKLCISYTQESDIPLNIDALWSVNKKFVVSLGLALLSPRFLGSVKAHEKREILLPWLTKKLLELDEYSDLPMGILHDVYMHCSYADRRDKHDIKKSINVVVRQLLKQNELSDVTKETLRESIQHLKKVTKPTLLVVLEWFNKNHSVYRTHSRHIEATKKYFHVIGMGVPAAVDEVGKEIFDEFIDLNQDSIFDNLRIIKKLCEDRKIPIIYMPSVGMFQQTIFLSNLRFAPLQITSTGHTATTHSDKMDYYLVDEDFVGDPECFSEKLMLAPKNAMPSRPPNSLELIDLKPPTSNAADKNLVDICVASTTMKLNPKFLIALDEIRNKSNVEVRFHFLVGQAIGLTVINVERVLKKFLGDSVILYPHQPYHEYMKIIEKMDLFLNPFPFGNMNGIVDTVSAGLVGVCKIGPEVHEGIDGAFFRRLGFPRWMVADTTDKYVSAAVRLINNNEERRRLRVEYAGYDKASQLFKGQPEIVPNLFMDALKSLQ